MSRIEELEKQLRDELTRQEREGYAKTSEELQREYFKKLKTLFTVTTITLPHIMAVLRIYLKVLEGIDPLAAIVAETMANTLKYAVDVAEVPE